jgi:hypothetical protein
MESRDQGDEGTSDQEIRDQRSGIRGQGSEVTDQSDA